MRLPVDSIYGVTLVGGGIFSQCDLDMALTLAPMLVAADGGANKLMDCGHIPQHVIGDLDSLDAAHLARLGDRLVHIAEQDSTDFDKSLRALHAPFILALGFDGARLDHTLAAMSSLVRHGRARVVLLAAKDICFLAPPRLALTLPVGARVSLFPMAPVSGRSTGLHWPIDGIQFAPAAQIGTSNHAESDRILLEFDHPGMLVLLERAHLAVTLDALQASPDWR
ncbi:thiamine pyrophosphokinase [Roseinatronobacter thiooxidans]|uniref:Thiamine diphosphokinase n=2 Tax=Roseinatronobacter thiooxidans TaxID=121821 RepID=A0A2W7Q5B6_9RHOB|nr:thiamine pyrophosphokinase [Roseinatronobacter thiooxidans]